MFPNLVRWTFQSDNQCKFGEMVNFIFCECEDGGDESDMAVTDMMQCEHFYETSCGSIGRCDMARNERCLGMDGIRTIDVRIRGG